MLLYPVKLNLITVYFLRLSSSSISSMNRHIEPIVRTGLNKPRVTLRKITPKQWDIACEETSQSLKEANSHFSDLLTKKPHLIQKLIDSEEMLPPFQYLLNDKEIYSDDSDSDSDNDSDNHSHYKANKVINNNKKNKHDKFIDSLSPRCTQKFSYNKNKFRLVDCSQKKIRQISEDKRRKTTFKIDNS